MKVNIIDVGLGNIRSIECWLSRSNLLYKRVSKVEDFNIKKVNRKLSTTISTARTAKGMKQKDLATKINVLPALIQKYENGQAIPDQQVINKLQRVLGIKLTGKDFK